MMTIGYLPFQMRCFPNGMHVSGIRSYEHMTSAEAVRRLTTPGMVSDQNTAINVVLDFLYTNNHGDVADAYKQSMQSYANSSAVYTPPDDPLKLNQ